jgi:hypothetical protein
MAKDFTVELRCHKNADGTFDGQIYDDGNPVQSTDYIVENGDCDDMRELWKRARDQYSTVPQVNGECDECFSEQFYEEESYDPE